MTPYSAYSDNWHMRIVTYYAILRTQNWCQKTAPFFQGKLPLLTVFCPICPCLESLSTWKPCCTLPYFFLLRSWCGDALELREQCTSCSGWEGRGRDHRGEQAFRICGFARRNGQPHHGRTVAHFRGPGWPVFGIQGCRFLALLGPKSGPVLGARFRTQNWDRFPAPYSNEY